MLLPSSTSCSRHILSLLSWLSWCQGASNWTSWVHTTQFPTKALIVWFGFLRVDSRKYIVMDGGTNLWSLQWPKCDMWHCLGHESLPIYMSSEISILNSQTLRHKIELSKGILHFELCIYKSTKVLYALGLLKFPPVFHYFPLSPRI